MATTQTVRTSAPPTAPRPGKLRSVLFLIALLLVVFSRKWIPGIEYDWLNIVPLLALVYIGYAVVTLDKTFGYVSYIARCLSEDPSVKKPAGRFLFSPYVRSVVLILLALGMVEFGLRMRSYHRALVYERHGNLLFTPIPNQKYMEKITLTPSSIDSYGLRGGPVPASALQEGNPTILCLGDSVTYGYGVDDGHTYAADLQKDFDQTAPGRYAVLNGGVDAYPIALEDAKFLYLWDLGIRPKVVIVGYSFNEGGIGMLSFGNDEAAKAKFAERVKEKNELRSIALYTLVVENWARHYYDRIKGKLVPGTNFTKLSETEATSLYKQFLDRFVSDLRAHNVQPVFLLFAGFDGRTQKYDDQGLLQVQFADYAQQNGIPLLRSKDALAAGEPEGFNISPFFIDHAHMNEGGTERVAAALAQFLPKVMAASASGQ
jgi:lysophospholipase L1-like esterase